MTLYYNPLTEEYPRHPGDIKLIDPSWEVGQPLPEPWVEVDFQEPTPFADGETIEADGLELIEGIWKNKWKTRLLTQEEIDERVAQELADQKRRDGLTAL